MSKKQKRKKMWDFKITELRPDELKHFSNLINHLSKAYDDQLPKVLADQLFDVHSADFKRGRSR